MFSRRARTAGGTPLIQRQQQCDDRGRAVDDPGTCMACQMPLRGRTGPEVIQAVRAMPGPRQVPPTPCQGSAPRQHQPLHAGVREASV